MGYTHYWKRKKEISLSAMQGIVSDFQKALGELEKHIQLAGASGRGKAVISLNEISFNGSTNCGHEKHELGITWPSAKAGGIAVPYTENAQNGMWFAGAQLDKRMCGGDCSHESVFFPRIIGQDHKPIEEIAYYNAGKAVYNDKNEVGLYFEFCKTAFKPYDLAVITFLIIAKYHLKDQIIINSDGQDCHWFDGKMLCQIQLGYGLDFVLDQETGHLIRKEAQLN